jgi:hypothetical protein
MWATTNNKNTCTFHYIISPATFGHALVADKFLVKMWQVKSTGNDTNESKLHSLKNKQHTEVGGMLLTFQLQTFTLLISHPKMQR